MAFLVLEKNLLISNIRLRVQEVIRGHVHRTEKTLAVRSKPEETVETVSLKMRKFFFSYAKILGKFSTKMFFFHNFRSLQENNARSAANQSARTIVAI